MSDAVKFGSRANVATLIKKLEDAHGNKNGIPGDEALSAGDRPPEAPQHASAFATNPLLYKLKAFFEVGLSKKDEQARIADFLAHVESGKSVASIERPAHVGVEEWNSYRADKAIAALRFDRDPHAITERIVKASGSVNGQPIVDRDVFTQRWPASEPKKNTTVVLSPGFLESGRNYYEQAQLLNEQGYDVVILDHQWAGMSSGPKGGIDRGFGIARDVASVVADVHAQDPGAKIVIAGTSMGGGAGASLATLMNDNGRVQLNGAQMPREVPFVGQDPYFARSGGLLNASLSGLGKVPLVNQIPLPAIGAPILSGDRATLMKLAMHATTEHLTGRAQAFHASDTDLATAKQLLESGELVAKAKSYIIHAKGDTLADYEATAAWAKLLGAHLHSIDSTSHVIEENPSEQRLILDALRFLEG